MVQQVQQAFEKEVKGPARGRRRLREALRAHVADLERLDLHRRLRLGAGVETAAPLRRQSMEGDPVAGASRAGRGDPEAGSGAGDEEDCEDGSDDSEESEEGEKGAVPGAGRWGSEAALGSDQDASTGVERERRRDRWLRGPQCGASAPQWAESLSSSAAGSPSASEDGNDR